jgi:hypothetical protein
MMNPADVIRRADGVPFSELSASASRTDPSTMRSAEEKSRAAGLLTGEEIGLLRPSPLPVPMQLPVLLYPRRAKIKH